MKWMWIGACLVLAIVVAMAATMTVPASTITPDEVTLRLFPQETQGVAFIDLAALRSTPLFQELVREKVANQLPGRVKEFVDATGFEVDKDIDGVTVGRVGNQEALVIVKAHYDRPRVEYFINGKQIPNETYMGRIVYHPGPEISISFIDNTADSLIVAGTGAAVKAAIDRMGSVPRSSLIQNSKLMDQIRTVESGNQVWAVGEFSPDLLPIGGPLAAKGLVLLSAFRGGVYQMRIDDNIHARATGNFKDVESARTAGDLLRGLLAVAKLQVAQQQDLLHLLDGVRVDYSGDTMTVGIDASGDLLKKLKEYRATLERAE